MSVERAARLHDSLGAVRSVFQSFLSDCEAGLLLSVSRCSSACLLSGYTFCQHVFRPESAERLRAMTALYERLRDEPSGRSLLPSSLLALALGWVAEKEEASTSMFAHLACLAASGELREEEAVAASKHGGHTLLRRVQPGQSWCLRPYSAADGGLSRHQPIAAGAIPEGVRFLQLSWQSEQALLPGSIPSTVTFVQCCGGLQQPLAGPLPDGLTHLILGERCIDLLLPPSSSLPSSLQQLRFDHWDQPLHVGSLPPRLQRLDMGQLWNQPLPASVLPASLTHVKLSDRFNQPLVRGSIAEGVVHLSLGAAFNQPLRRGVLPSTLRELVLGDGFRQPLEVGSLPSGLQLLRLPNGYSQPLSAALWPACLQLLDVSGYAGEVAEGVLPASLRWVALDESQIARAAVPRGTSCLMSWDMFG